MTSLTKRETKSTINKGSHGIILKLLFKTIICGLTNLRIIEEKIKNRENNVLEKPKEIKDKTKKAIEKLKIGKEEELGKKLMVLIVPNRCFERLNKARKLTRKYKKMIEEFETKQKGI